MQPLQLTPSQSLVRLSLQLKPDQTLDQLIQSTGRAYASVKSAASVMTAVGLLTKTGRGPAATYRVCEVAL